jgi:hypothetical protein
MARRLVADSRFKIWATVQAGRLINVAPRWLPRALGKLTIGSTTRLHDEVRLKDYSHLTRESSRAE